MMPVVKICGMVESENIMAAAELKPDIMGFIFYPQSPRFAGEVLNAEILSNLPSGIRKAGVFVNAGFITIMDTVRKYSLDIIQLHGTETQDFCRRIKDTGTEVIKVFNISSNIDFKTAEQFIPYADYFLFETATENHGGSGQKFDWKLLDRYETGHPFFLSGGITPADSDKILGITHHAFHGIDLNSRFEIKPGLKDINKLKEFINELRNKHNQL